MDSQLPRANSALQRSVNLLQSAFGIGAAYLHLKRGADRLRIRLAGQVSSHGGRGTACARVSGGGTIRLADPLAQAVLHTDRLREH